MKARQIVVPLFAMMMAAAIGGCSALSNKAASSQQLIKVVRGDLTVTVSGSGKLDPINSRMLTFAIPGQVSHVYVGEGQRVAKGDRIASLSTDSLELAVSQAELSVAQAQAGIAQADVGVKTAQQILDAALGRPTYTEVKTAQSDVDEAKAYLQYITTNMANSAPGQQQSWATALIYAQQKLAAAEAKLDALLGNYDTEEIATKRSQLESAKQQSALAQETLEFAQTSLDHARTQLNDATLYAPFDGWLATLDVREKDSVTPAVILGQLIDTSAMKLEIQVDEIDIPDVKPGLAAVVDLDALPSLKIQGTVGSISLLPSPQSGVVVYDAQISLNVPANSGLRPGMSASADIVLAERKGVLLIPDRAIGKNSKGETIVTVSKDGKSEERVIAAGIDNGVQTEVISGLVEGESIVVERPAQQNGSLF